MSTDDVPATAPTSGDSFFGLDRSTDPMRLAGVRYTAGSLTRVLERLRKAEEQYERLDTRLAQVERKQAQ